MIMIARTPKLTTRLWLDTEFNGFGGELISFALVDQHDRSLYCELRPPANIVPFVAEHVVPKLTGPGASLEQVQHAIEDWLRLYEAIHVIADWPEDIAHFARLLLKDPMRDPGNRIDTPPITLEIFEDLCGSHSEYPHHALADARGMRDRHLAMELSK